MSALHLYQLTDKYKALEALAAYEDLPPDVVRDTLEALEGEWQDKAVAVAAFVRNLEASAKNISDAAAAMAARAKRLDNRADSLRAYLQLHMQAMSQKRIDSEMFVIRLADNPPAVVVDDEAKIPGKFWVQPDPPPRRLDKGSIAKAIKAGEVVPGAHTERGQSLRIDT